MGAQKIFSYFTFFFLLASLIFFWRSVDLPCQKPLAYALGSFDLRFGISREDFLKEAALSEKLWEDAYGNELFSYSPDAAFKINLIFDERQIQTLDAKELSDALSKTQNLEANLTAKQNETLSAYKKAVTEYERMLLSFKKQLSAYNAEVEKWNRRGGAPEDEYQNLQDIAKTLDKKQKQLEEKRKEVNALALAVNSFSEKKVSVVEEYNDKVEEYVNQYGEPKEFDQGDYVGTEINIYQFDDRPHLEAVMVHEFGHALGLAHGSSPASIMYPLMEKQKLDPVTLSQEDKQMLFAQCNQGIWEIVLKTLQQAREKMKY